MTCTITRILVPTDFSAASDAALSYAKTLAGKLGASIHLLHVFEDPCVAATCTPEVYVPLPLEMREAALRDAEARLEDRLSSLDKARLRGTTTIVTGLTAKEIVEYAHDFAIDLIVMGTHGRRGFSHLMLGSVAEHVVRIATCPVLTVPATAAARTRTADRQAVEPLMARSA